MVKLKVFITREIPGTIIPTLKKYCDVKIYPKKTLISKQELIKAIKWCDILVCLLTEKIDEEILKANPKLKLIANYATGYDNINIKKAKELGIPVANTPRVSANAVAEHTFALIMYLAKRLCEADCFVRIGSYKCWDPELLLGHELEHKTLGIIGVGSIGSRVTEIANKGFRMKILYNDIKRNKKYEKMYQAEYCSKEKLLKESDFVTLHVPLLKSTHHLISDKELKLMKKTAYLINTSRGGVIDEKSLVKSLQKKQIAGAGLDVYEFEPKLTKGLTKLKNIILTPHIASSTIETREEMGQIILKNILAVIKGQKPITQVN